MHDLSIEGVTLLLLVATLVALAARRLRLPYTVGLVVTGLGLALLHFKTAQFALTPHLIYVALLPPLLFEAALSLHWSELRRDALPILLLATLGVVISMLIVAAGMGKLAGWPWQSALVFGALIAATDPVAVIATFKQAGVVGRLRLLVDSESLLNDGVAAVLFVLVLSVAQGGGVTPLHVTTSLLTTAFGGMAVGLACGGVAVALTGRTEDALVETALTVVTAYGAFLLAEHFHMSGVLATVCAGILMGNVGLLRESESAVLTPRGREIVIAFWDFAAFFANSLIFLLIGLRLARISFPALGWSALLAAVGLTLVGRALSVYPLCGLLVRSRKRVPLREQHILFWGGLRGALALALVLSLPQSFPMRDAIVIATFGTVAFSVIVQGSTMPWLLRRLGVN